MLDSLYLGWQYVKHNRFTSGLLVTAVTLIIFLPAALQVIIYQAEQHLRYRAESTPLLIGPRGSELELVLASIYFDRPLEQVMRYEEQQRVQEQDLGTVIPLHTRFEARDVQVVGTTHEYFKVRNLTLSEGRSWDLLGECVVGSRVANQLGVVIGDKLSVSSSPAFVIDSPPLRLRVVGLLAPCETPDDEVILVDIETTWILEGLGHGHDLTAEHGSPEAKQFTDITEGNASTFHFHGSRDSFPVTSLMVFPNSVKAQTLLLGQYFSPDETVQIVQPQMVIQALMKRVLKVRSYIFATIGLVSCVTLLIMVLVIVLSVRLRRPELLTMTKLGCSRSKIAAILGIQILLILASGFAVSATLVTISALFGTELVRQAVRVF